MFLVQEALPYLKDDAVASNGLVGAFMFVLILVDLRIDEGAVMMSFTRSMAAEFITAFGSMRLRPVDTDMMRSNRRRPSTEAGGNCL